MIEKLPKMKNKIKVIQDDIMNQKELLSKADVVIMNNVFEFFVAPEEQEKIWKFIKQTVTKKGTTIISIPSLQDSFDLAKIQLKTSDWVEEIPLEHLETESEEEIEDFQLIHCYKVL